MLSRVRDKKKIFSYQRKVLLALHAGQLGPRQVHIDSTLSQRRSTEIQVNKVFANT